MDVNRQASDSLNNVANSWVIDMPNPEIGEARLAEAMTRSSKNVARPRFIHRVVENEENEENILFKEELPEDMEEHDLLLEEDLFNDLQKEKQVLFEWLSFILIIILLICSLRLPYLREKKLWEIELSKWQGLALVVICGRLFSVWIFKVVVSSFERNLLFKKRVSFFVYDLRKRVQKCLWLGLVLIAWLYLFDEKIVKETNTKALSIMTRLLASLLVGTTLWLVKIVLLNVLASNFYISTYFKRILDSIFSQYIIEALSGPPLTEIQEEERNTNELRNVQNVGTSIPSTLGGPSLNLSAKKPFKKGHKKHHVICINLLHRLTPENISTRNVKRLMDIVQHGTLSMSKQIQDNNYQDESTRFKSEFEAEIVAIRIFRNVAKPGSRYIFWEDITRFMRDVEASRTQSLLNGGSKSKKISLSALKRWVVNVFKERRVLGLTLNDSQAIVSTLHTVLNILLSITILVICLVVLRIKTSKFSNAMLFIISQLLMFSFMFGNTLKNTFEAVLFIFVTHPFDVGDCCEIDGVEMEVEEMKILDTVFLKRGEKMTISNSVLATKMIINKSRSLDTEDEIMFYIDLATPTKKIAMMKERIESCISNKEKHWYPKPKIICMDTDDLNKLRYKVLLVHRMKHQDLKQRWDKRGRVVEEIAKILREMDMIYSIC